MFKGTDGTWAFTSLATQVYALMKNSERENLSFRRWARRFGFDRCLQEFWAETKYMGKVSGRDARTWGRWILTFKQKRRSFKILYFDLLFIFSPCRALVLNYSSHISSKTTIFFPNSLFLHSVGLTNCKSLVEYQNASESRLTVQAPTAPVSNERRRSSVWFELGRESWPSSRNDSQCNF